MVMVVTVVVMPAMAVIVAGMIIVVVSVRLAQWVAPG
jgi:hypothetical protein